MNQPNSFQYIKNYHILLLFSEQVEKATRITNLTIFNTWKTKYNKTRVLFGLFLKWLFVSIFEIEIVWWRNHNAFRKKLFIKILCNRASLKVNWNIFFSFKFESITCLTFNMCFLTLFFPLTLLFGIFFVLLWIFKGVFWGNYVNFASTLRSLKLGEVIFNNCWSYLKKVTF